ncbi:hypothetical protein N7505_006599 [Penicillium chrysogenum]|uniref:Uncharacterized protein n=1 Tax=Penicillium chrysogenum TaxID=5076 RepID=A0ABQ8WM32_PENCH|nr:hypothetical protein N7505_006599 [Penicillium chrysogenum]
MGNGKGKNKGKGRGKKRSRSLKENKVPTKVEIKPEDKIEDKIEIKGKHHCLLKRPTHAPTSRCLRLGHVVQCPIHPNSFPRRLSECVPCNSADERLVQQERKNKKK